MTNEISRRRWLERAGILGLGATAGSIIPGVWSSLGTTAWGAADEEDAEARVKKLGLELPALGKPSGATLVPAVRVGELLFVSGHGPRRADGERWTGKVGKEVDLKEAQAAARSVGLITLSVVRNELGSLNKVVRLVKVLGMVNAVPEFTDQPKVINAFSDLMVEVFGETNGKGARSAVGMGSLPGGIPVEIEAIFQVRG